MRQRRGITLIEVLIAIFVMGIGMLALLVLFPVGALSMARAVRDDRCAHASANATALAIAWDLRSDARVTAALDSTPGPFRPPFPDGPSYPVYVDPFYKDLDPATDTLGAGGGSPGLIRCTVNYGGGGQTAAARYFTLLDDIKFDNTGLPAGGVVDRAGAFTWAYLVRRPKSGLPNIVDLTVVVYHNRSTLVPQGEDPFAASGTAGENSLTVTWTGTPPAIRPGTWLLDVTREDQTIPDLNPPVVYDWVHAHFYRVVNTQDAGSSSMRLELQQPLRANVDRVVVMENVVEVFEKGTGWKP